MSKAQAATIRPWNTDLSTMPTEGHFEVLRVYDGVFRHETDKPTVIHAKTGRMFVPHAWRPSLSDDT